MSQSFDAQRSLDGGVGEKLSVLLDEAKLPRLEPSILKQFEAYLALLLRWNGRTNLTSIRTEDGILRRHFVESIACAHALPQEVRTLLDFGSGGGLPGIPIALCRPDIDVTVAESQGKKAAFLCEVARSLPLRLRVHAGRAEALTERFQCVTLRAVDRMQDAVVASRALVEAAGWLCLLTTEEDACGLTKAVRTGFSWKDATDLPGSVRRIMVLGRKEQ
jgi:16S rRNA (guanine527-N7)-methyltransferase